MDFFKLNENEFLTFFAVLTRFSVLIGTLPFLSDRSIPGPLKILFSLAVAVVMYPVLVSTGVIFPADAAVWGATTKGILTTLTAEILFALALSFGARIIFDAFQIGGNIAGNFMGFAAASQFDPHFESQTQVIAQIQTTLAMLLFLTMDGHHVMLRAALESYRIVGLGKASLGGEFNLRLLNLTGDTLRVGLQIAGPIAISLFAVNIVYGVMAKALPQLNVLVLSFSVSALVGMFVMLMSLPEFHSVSGTLFTNLGEQMGKTMLTLKGGN